MAARILSDSERGLWLGLQLAYSYGQQLHLGVLFGLFREVPMVLARKDPAAAARAKGVAFGFILGVAVIGALVLLLAIPRFSAGARRYVAATAILTLTTLFKAYYVTVFKAESRFRELSISATIGSVISLMTVGLVWVAGLDGLIWGMFLQTVVEAGWLMRTERIPHIRFDLNVLRGLMAVGALTLLVAIGTVFLTSVDRTVMLSRLGSIATGAYYIGANLAILLPALVGLLSSVLTPRFFERFGATGDARALADLVERPIRFASAMLAAVLGFGAIALPVTIARIWPALVPGNNAALLALAATFPLGLGGLVVNVFYAVNRQSVLIIILGVSTAVGFGCGHVGASLSHSISGVAAGSMIGIWTYYVAASLSAYRIMYGKISAGIRPLLVTLLPATLATVLVVGLGRLPWPTQNVVAQALLAETLFLACMGPIVWREWGRLRRGPQL